jgi:hypothetical protein
MFVGKQTIEIQAREINHLKNQLEKGFWAGRNHYRHAALSSRALRIVQLKAYLRIVDQNHHIHCARLATRLLIATMAWNILKLQNT